MSSLFCNECLSILLYNVIKNMRGAYETGFGQRQDFVKKL